MTANFNPGLRHIREGDVASYLSTDFQDLVDFCRPRAPAVLEENDLVLTWSALADDFRTLVVTANLQDLALFEMAQV